MPTRIKPVLDLGPCVITFGGIKGIVELINKNFTESLFSAHDKAWEVYDEPYEPFLEQVARRETLDSFTIQAKALPIIDSKEAKRIRIVFSKSEAKLEFAADPSHEDWLEHFIIDLRKYIQPAASPRFLSLLMSILFSSSLSSGPLSIYGSTFPYCRIIIQQKLPNLFYAKVALCDQEEQAT